MTQKLPPVGILHCPIVRKLIDLADVVEKASHQQKIHIDTLVVLHHLED